MAIVLLSLYGSVYCALIRGEITCYFTTIYTSLLAPSLLLVIT